MKKEKVIAIRVTQEQYDILEWARLNWFPDEAKGKTMSRFVAHLLRDDINTASINRDVKLKREEAAAKRKAKKAANGK